MADLIVSLVISSVDDEFRTSNYYCAARLQLHAYLFGQRYRSLICFIYFILS